MWFLAWGLRCGVCVWERERTAVDFVLGSEREGDPDKLEQLGRSLLDVPHLVQPHVGCVRGSVLVRIKRLGCERFSVGQGSVCEGFGVGQG